MILEMICPHCGKKTVESYGIINPYLYGSKIQKCRKCGGEFFDNRWREVAIQGFDPIQDTEVKYSSWFGFGLIAAALSLTQIDPTKMSFGSPTVFKVGIWFMFILGGLILIIFFRHVFGFVKRKNKKYMAESVQRMHDPEYVNKLCVNGVRIPSSLDFKVDNKSQ
ncbi:MAG: hypothetical protein K6E47_12220 [Lachnospiraceae bacterium]|nr:hypothetical protein [Lachnospiraceae bacterium]